MSSSKAFMERARRCRREQAKATRERDRAAGAGAGSDGIAPGEIWSLVAGYLGARAELWEERAGRPARRSPGADPGEGWAERIVLH